MVLVYRERAIDNRTGEVTVLDPETGEVPANGHVRILSAGRPVLVELAHDEPTAVEFAAWEAAGRPYPPPWVTEKHAGRYETPPPGGVA